MPKILLETCGVKGRTCRSNESSSSGDVVIENCNDDDDSDVICIDSPHLKKNLSNNSNFGGVDVWWVECSCY